VKKIRIFAPATVANLGPGFDLLGLALERPGDVVEVTQRDAPGVLIRSIHGDDGRLPLDPEKNTAGIAAREVLRRSAADFGVELSIDKKMPLGSGLGSSASSAAAAAVGVNRFLERPLSEEELVSCCVEAEAVVSGRHADNVAPAVMGGLVLVRSVDPLDIVRLPIPAWLTVCVVTPKFELPTKLAREALPKSVPMPVLIQNAASLASLIHALHRSDLELLGRSLDDLIVTPARAPLIPGCVEVIGAAKRAGALGSSISGAGPSIFALCRDAKSAEQVAGAMRDAFLAAGLPATYVISNADCPGAREE
jgi:homoserine kinase